MDLFRDTTETKLINDAIAAIRATDASALNRAIHGLLAENPSQLSIPALREMLDVIGATHAHGLMSSPAAVATALNRLRAASIPLGDGCVHPLLLLLATKDGAAVFSPDIPTAFRANLLALAGDFAGSTAAAISIPGWENIPIVRRWECISRWRLHSTAALQSLFEYAWLDPEGVHDVVLEIDGEALYRICRGFNGDLPEHTPDWLPAWCTVTGRLVPGGEPFSASPPALGYRLAQECMALERRGHSNRLVSARQKLRDLDVKFFEWYMRGRAVRHQ